VRPTKAAEGQTYTLFHDEAEATRILALLRTRSTFLAPRRRRTEEGRRPCYLGGEIDVLAFSSSTELKRLDMRVYAGPRKSHLHNHIRLHYSEDKVSFRWGRPLFFSERLVRGGRADFRRRERCIFDRKELATRSTIPSIRRSVAFLDQLDIHVFLTQARPQQKGHCRMGAELGQPFIDDWPFGMCIWSGRPTLSANPKVLG
jgi:hypothetical protein